MENKMIAKYKGHDDWGFGIFYECPYCKEQSRIINYCTYCGKRIENKEWEWELIRRDEKQGID